MAFFSFKRLFGAVVSLALVIPNAWGQDRYDALAPCELSTAGGQLTTEALCGTLSVSENPNEALGEGRMLELAYAVLPARNGKGLPDPVFFLAGGPGQAARDMAPIMHRALRDVHRNRDLIFLDQRGTGGSNALDCEFIEPEDALITPDPSLAAAQLLACLNDWDADVRFYTTTEAVQDIDTLRQHLGFDKINLIGGSYGTRVGQVYLKNHGQHVRTALLDGVVPMRLALGSEHGPSLDRTLNALVGACLAETTCQQAFPNLDTALEKLKEEYDSWTEGPKISVTHPRVGEAVDMTFSRAVLATALRFLAYDPASQMLMPYLIHEAATTGNPQRIAAQALIVSEQMDDAIAIGLNFAVGCIEDWPQWPDQADVQSTLLGDSIGELYNSICPDWPGADLPDGFNSPYQGDVPMLLFSGELDPVTPPAYGEEVMTTSANALHLIADGRGHIVMTLPCMARIAADFIDQASVENLDVSCMEALGSEPFFTDLLGPTP